MDLMHVTSPHVTAFPVDLPEWQERRYTVVDANGEVFNLMDRWTQEPTPCKGDVIVWERFVDDEDMDLLGCWYVAEYLDPSVPTVGPEWEEFSYED
jgi:hypothetical protein